MSTLSARQLTVRVGSRTLVDQFSVDFVPGEFVAILGRNGSGKTLSLQTLGGLRRPLNGEVTLDGAPLAQLGHRKIARRLGFLAQDLEEGFVTTTLESVRIGRHPHLSLWQWESEEDDRIAHAALRSVQMDGCAERLTDTLSGGEKRRVFIASLLAQDPEIFLLDEPTNHLDPHHQLAVLALFRQLARTGRTVVATLHDPTLAARFADRALLLSGDGTWKMGPVEETITAATLSELYLTPMMELEKAGRRVFVPT